MPLIIRVPRVEGDLSLRRLLDVEEGVVAVLGGRVGESDGVELDCGGLEGQIYGLFTMKLYPIEDCSSLDETNKIVIKLKYLH